MNRISSPGASGSERSTAQTPLVALSTNARPSGVQPRKAVIEIEAAALEGESSSRRARTRAPSGMGVGGFAEDPQHRMRR